MGRAGVSLALALAVTAGCAAGVRPEVLQAWVGRPVAALEKEWGAATRETQDGELRLLIYEEVERRTPRSSGFAEQDPSQPARAGTYAAAQRSAELAYSSPRVYVRSYLFWVNREGKIVHSTVRTP